MYVKRSGVNVLRKILIDDLAISSLVILEQPQEVVPGARSLAVVVGLDEVIEAGSGLITCRVAIVSFELRSCPIPALFLSRQRVRRLLERHRCPPIAKWSAVPSIETHAGAADT
jgi:hypothetical protein